jgi:DsbC/DsbD-like thiol-disulfide interchange protein
MIMMNWIIIIPVYLLAANKQIILSDVLKVTVPEVVVSAGENSVIKVKVEIKKGYHIQANKVKDDLLIPTTLEMNGDKNITTGEQKFPPAKKFKLEGTDNFLDVYDGVVEIGIPFKTIKEIAKGRYLLNAKLNYQACDHRTCLFPKTIGFSITVKVV